MTKTKHAQPREICQAKQASNTSNHYENDIVWSDWKPTKKCVRGV